jgi:hypothetical protein
MNNVWHLHKFLKKKKPIRERKVVPSPYSIVGFSVGKLTPSLALLLIGFH